MKKIKKYHQFLLESVTGKKAVIITGEGFQDQEVLVPKSTLESAGVEVTIAGIKLGEVKAYNSDKSIQIDALVDELSPDSFNILIIPGGSAPEILREDDGVIKFVTEFSKLDKPIAAICHGPQILVSAGLVAGRTLTSFPDVKSEIVSHEGNWIDRDVVIDNNLITSRNPNDLPKFSEAILKVLN